MRRFLLRIVEVILGVKHQHQKPELDFIVGPVSRKGDPMRIVLTDEQQITIGINPRTAKGRPAQIDGAPTFTSSDPAVIEVVATDDPKKVTVVARGIGVAALNVSADADLGEGVRTLSGSIDFNVDAAGASDLGFEAGEPETQP